MTFERLEQNSELLLLKCISGSNAYGLNLPTSDIDYKGVFLLPPSDFYRLDYTAQVHSESNNDEYFELKRFIELLVNNNPSILELLNTPEDCILYKHPLLNEIKTEMFLSKMCAQSFAGFVKKQVKKARGLNKKIVNPIDKELKTVLDFCYVVSGKDTLDLNVWMSKNGFEQQDFGLVSLSHMRDMYALFHRQQFAEAVHLRGIIASGEKSNDVSLSSIPQNYAPLTVMSFNKDGYSSYCKDYREYWGENGWVNNRNEDRYANSLQHGKNYDTKNMMHVFRLLGEAEEIAREKKVNVRRNSSDREYLLRIRSGEFAYDDLVSKAEERLAIIDELYKTCDLPETADIDGANELLYRLRDKLYQKKGAISSDLIDYIYPCSSAKYFNVGRESYLHEKVIKAANELTKHFTLTSNAKN